jgi:hypothetical protein
MIDDAVEPAIYKGFFWNNPLEEVLALKPLCRVEGQQLEALEEALVIHMKQSSGAGSVQGIPDRTLLLPDHGVRIVYGGSMGREIGIHSLDGSSRRGFFHSDEFLELLRRAERSSRGWWRFW